VPRIEGNIIRKCDVGIDLGALDKTLSANTIGDCNTGIAVTSGGITGNILHHNNFSNNTVNAVDQGRNRWDFEGQGNFWSDYIGTDTDHGGIGDTAYAILPNGSDPYPLISPNQDWALSAFTEGRIVYPQLALGGEPKSYESIVVVSNKTNFNWGGSTAGLSRKPRRLERRLENRRADSRGHILRILNPSSKGIGENKDQRNGNITDGISGDRS